MRFRPEIINWPRQMCVCALKVFGLNWCGPEKKDSGHAAYQHRHRILRIACNLIMKSRLWRADGMRDMWRTPFQTITVVSLHTFICCCRCCCCLFFSNYHHLFDIINTHARTHKRALALRVCCENPTKVRVCVRFKMCPCSVFVFFPFFCCFVCVTVITVECL